MGRNHSAAMFVGVVVCVPLLALYHMGWLLNSAAWLRDIVLPRLVVLPAEGLRLNLPLQYTYYTAAAFASAWVCIELFSLWRKVAYLLGMVFLTCSFSVVMAWLGIVFEPFSGIIAALTAGAIGIVISSGARGYRRHMLRRFFVGRLWTRSFDELARQDQVEKLTERREVTVLTCRMTNHLDISEEAEARAFEAFTAHFEQKVSEFLVARGGYLDTCTAQRIRVLFGYPLADEHHALHACQVMLQLRDHWPTLQREMQARWMWKPRLGAALATGTVACGLYGHHEFQSFSAVGEAVDLSDRLCGLNMVYGSHILLNARTYALVKEGVEVRPMEMVVTPRQKQVTEVYELLGVKGDLDEAEASAREAFRQGILHLRKGERDLARASFEQARLEGREDPPLRYFMERATESKKDKAGDPAAAPPKHARPLNAV
jgi:class 3 adenylate cyclase